MLSQQKAGDRSRAGKGGGGGAAALDGHNDALPLDLLASGEKCPPLAATNNGNKLLNYQLDSPTVPPPPPLNDGDDDERLAGEWRDQPAGRQLGGDIDSGRPVLARANSLNTNSTGERSKCDDENDEELEGFDDGNDDEKRRFLDETNETETSVGREEGKKKKSFVKGKKDEGSRKKANLARQESIFDQERASVVSSGGESAREKNKGQKKDKQKTKTKKKKRRQEPGDGDAPPAGRQPKSSSQDPNSCCCSCLTRMFQFLSARKWLVIPILLLVIYSVAIYCLPFLTQLEPKVPDKLPVIPFDFNQGPLRPSTASAFKAERLFKDQLHGPESLAFDSQGNCYTAVEGGFVLYAHLNRSSPMKRAYLDAPPAAGLPPSGASALLQQRLEQQQPPDLIKIADLNGMRQVVVGARTARPQRDSNGQMASSSGSGRVSWQRECQLDEKVYGPQLYEHVQLEPGRPNSFKSNVRVSRCSKPLGVRLSRDESSLYVIDTLSGLYRVNLRAADKPRSTSQRQVTKLIDFRVNDGRQVLPAIQLEDETDGPGEGGALQATRLMNVSLKALDDLVIDHRRGHDLIYMTVASQQWPATSFVYDALEGRPSGLVLRYDTSTSLLAVLEPARLAHVRTSAVVADERDRRRFNQTLLRGRPGPWPSILMGAPRLDENDVFDDRRLNFPNGLELTDDGRALLIADTLNKRIIRHYVRGARRGTSDLWAWTPMFPDNIRRGQDGQRETYWVVGCGKSPSSLEAKLPAALAPGDVFSLLRTWPRVRKFLLKNLYFVGYLVESMGAKVLKSHRVEDVGYELRTGSSLLSSGCVGMMIIQYNQFGDIIQSVHSREFPNDLQYYSQVNELVDPGTGERSLYLGSPSYNYITKLILPPSAESQVPPSPSSGPPNGMPHENGPSESMPPSAPLLSSTNRDRDDHR